jgi:mannose-1-phosphate guanylyltransferase
MLHAVIMAGGSGTRFWPLSRKSLPKQFLRLTSERSLIQQAWDRVAAWIPPDRICVVAGHSHRPLLGEHLPQLRHDRIYLEPCGRNTAPAIGWAASRVLEHDPDAVMLVMPADHIIEPEGSFKQAVLQAAEIVQSDPEQLVLFGIRPNHAATGYGYIETGSRLSGDSRACRVAAFREKPDKTTAEQYLRQGNFLWNAGIFVWRADRILSALRERRPQLAASLAELPISIDAADFTSRWNQLESISIDYAVLEHDPKVCVIPAEFEWDDVGSWESLARRLPVDERGNVVIQGACSLVNTTSSIVLASDGHVVATSGLEDCIVIHTSDATLVAKRGDGESLRKVIEQLQAEGFDGIV